MSAEVWSLVHQLGETVADVRVYRELDGDGGARACAVEIMRCHGAEPTDCTWFTDEGLCVVCFHAVTVTIHKQEVRG